MAGVHDRKTLRLRPGRCRSWQCGTTSTPTSCSKGGMSWPDRRQPRRRWFRLRLCPKASRARSQRPSAAWAAISRARRSRRRRPQPCRRLHFHHFTSARYHRRRARQRGAAEAGAACRVASGTGTLRRTDNATRRDHRPSALSHRRTEYDGAGHIGRQW